MPLPPVPAETLSIDDPALPASLRTLIEAELDPGEHLTWLAQPLGGRLARQAVPAALFGGVWTLLAVLWTAGAAWGTGAAPADAGWFRWFPLFGLPFILVGLGLLLSPWRAHRRAGRSAYVLTNRRALLFLGHSARRTEVRAFVVRDPASEPAQAFRALARKVAQQVSILSSDAMSSVQLGDVS